MRYKLVVSYVGTRFVGWQRQAAAAGVQPSIQGTLERAVRKISGRDDTVVSGSSRTDAGVHAIANVAHVDIDRFQRKTGKALPAIPGEQLRRAVNFYLMRDHVPDVVVVDAQQVSPTFHARHRALERVYTYRIIGNAPAISPFERDRVLLCRSHLDLNAMQEAATLLEGYHDFSAFRSAGCQAKSPVRDVTSITVLPLPPPLSYSYMNGTPCFLEITMRARAFLYNQVRNMVGALLHVGAGKMSKRGLLQLLESCDRMYAPTMAPAHGLYLASVRYGETDPVGVTREENGVEGNGDDGAGEDDDDIIQ